MRNQNVQTKKMAKALYYTHFQWTEDRQGFQIQYLTLDT